MNEDIIRIILVVLIFIGVILWFKTFIAIVKSDNVHIVKIVYFLVIVSVPPIGILYPIAPFLFGVVKKDIKGAPKRLKNSASFFSKIIGWLFRK